MQVTLTIPESARPGITAARAAYNASLPATIEVPATEEGGEATQAPNPALLASDESYITFVVGRAVESYNANLGTAAPTPAPATPVVVNGVPQEVTRRQARQALILAGKFDLVQPAINAIPDATQRALMQSEWDDSQVFLRQRPALISMGYAIGLNDAGLDKLFVDAAKLA